MKCPNRKCGLETAALLVRVDKQGKVTEGCAACNHAPGDSNVRTGRKFWTGEEVYGKEKVKEKNFEFEKKTMERAVMNRRKYTRPSLLRQEMA